MFLQMIFFIWNRYNMDITTIGGIAVGVTALIMGILLEGGSLGAYVGISALIIIIGGTIGATATSFPLSTVTNVPRLLITAFTNQVYDVPQVIKQLVTFSERARREGILCLESELVNVKDEFLRYGLQLVIDGTDPELVRDTMQTKIAFTAERHHQGSAIFEAAGGYAPTIGIIGTVLGLINVLSNLANPSELGKSIAMAFIATLYGVGSANLVWLPIGSKLKQKHKSEQIIKEIMLEGVLCLQSGDNPRIVEQKLKAFLSKSYAATINTGVK
jgi:chemotaxis protein MotA